MQCPVCGAEAEDLSSGDFDGLIVGCKRCGDYAVADGALNDFLRLDFDARVSLLDGAKSAVSSGARPVIASASRL
jgi:hypothetical protein